MGQSDWLQYSLARRIYVLEQSVWMILDVDVVLELARHKIQHIEEDQRIYESGIAEKICI